MPPLRAPCRRPSCWTVDGVKFGFGPGVLGAAGALVYVFLWASAYVPSKIGVIDSSPLWFLVVRFAAAGAATFAIVVRAGATLPRTAAQWAAVAAYGVFGNALYLSLTYEALRHLASGVGAIVASLNPLVLAIVAPYVLRERLTPLKIGGLLLGFGGVVGVMAARAGSGSAEPSDVLLAFAGVVSSVTSTIVFKKFCGGLDLRITTSLQLLTAAAVLTPAALLFEGSPHVSWSPRIIAAFLYLVVVISIGASLLWFWLLTHGEASRVSAFYFLTPIFGLLIAYVLLGEQIGVRDLGGLAAIALGIFLVQRS
jgi:probable blue pigment (indigoidine) exporter